MSTFDRHPRLRWIVPGATVAVIAAGSLVGASSVTADPGLEPLTAAELLVAVQEPTTDSFSGTVEMTSDLGLPALPTSMGSAGTGPTALASGTNTMRVWADGPDRSRVALIGEAAEYDVIRNGDEVWTWSSADATATRQVLKAPEGAGYDRAAGMELPSTPAEAAELALSAIEPTTEVAVTGVASVAGRSVYELVLTPQDDTTRVARVALAIDAETKVPLRVQVYSTQMAEPALEVGFTSVDFTRPDASVFAFSPPPGATVTEHDAMGHDKESAATGVGSDATTVVGEGWSRVYVLNAPTPTADASGDEASAGLTAALEALPVVTADWGTGRVLDGTLLSAILTDDGRLAVGAVDPATLGAALAAG